MKAIELFAGGGGAALGLEAAGIHHAALVELNPAACATLRAAGFSPVVEGDVRDLDSIEAAAFPSESEVWDVAGDRLMDSDLNGEEWCVERERLATELWDQSRELDLLWSSFPCQAWSVGGMRKGAADDRNGWPWTVEAIDRFQPRWVVAENVRGLLRHSSEGHPNPEACPRCYFDHVILRQLRERYAHVGWWLLNAADYGVPQYRRRLIIWAGPAPLSLPTATHGDPATLKQGSLFHAARKPWRTMAETIGLGPDTFLPNVDRWINRPAPTLCARDWRGITMRKRIIEQIRNGESLEYCPRQSVNDVLFMYTGKRRIKLPDMARLQDFPVDYPLQGLANDKYVQLGNAVPPTLARVVGEAVIRADRAYSSDPDAHKAAPRAVQ